MSADDEPQTRSNSDVKPSKYKKKFLFSSLTKKGILYLFRFQSKSSAHERSHQ